MEEAIEGACDLWSANTLPARLSADLWKVCQFDALSDYVNIKNVEKAVQISSMAQEHISWLKTYQSVGSNDLILHDVNRNPEHFNRRFWLAGFNRFILKKQRFGEKIKQKQTGRARFYEQRQQRAGELIIQYKLPFGIIIK